MNLMLNGIDAMKDMKVGGKPTIRLQTQSGQLLISVSDIGAGLLPKHADRIFNAFFTTKLRGTGMGCPSAVQSLNRMVAPCGLLTSLRSGIFHLSLPTKDEAHE